MSNAIVHKEDETGYPSRGFAKVLTALQNYEVALEDFRSYLVKAYRKMLSEGKDPNWWEELWYGWTTRESKLKSKSLDFRLMSKFLNELDSKGFQCLEDNVWEEGLIFLWKVDVASWYKDYDNLRNVIRNGESYLLDDEACKFINHWVTHTSIFK